ncbi:MAG TPA: AMP-binding protein, partial [Pseudonocardia sp.]
MRIEESVTIDAPRARVWELVKDPAGYAGLLEWADFTPIEPDRDPGTGARYDMHVQVGSASVGGLVEIVEYDPECDIVWTSVTGVEQRGRLRLRTAPGEQTRLTMRMSYGAPGVLLGTLAELMSVRKVRASVTRSLRNVTYEAEGSQRPVPGGPSLPRRLVHELDNVRILAKAGIVTPMRPDRVVAIAMIGARWGASLATELVIGAVRHPQRTMLIDELGTLTYQQVDDRSNALANALGAEGIRAGDRVGLMSRDHRGFVQAAVALAKLGADTLLLNTSFSAPQLAEVCRREDAVALLHDEEFAELTEEAGKERRRFVVWREQDSQTEDTLAELIENGSRARPAPPPRAGRVTILTSGTTGTPKGATRTRAPLTLDPPAALLERIPLHEGQVVRIGAPLFHTWGFANFALGLALGSTFVLRRKFDPEQCLADIDRHRCDILVVVPVMLQRVLELPSHVRRRYDTGWLRAVCASGSAVSGELAKRWMDEFGDNLYNMYGSTEVASATLATPKDMRKAPGTAGKPARGSIVRLYDDRGRPVPQGQ